MFCGSIFISLFIFRLAWETSLGRAPQAFSCSARTRLHHHSGGGWVAGRKRQRTVHGAWVPFRLGGSEKRDGVGSGTGGRAGLRIGIGTGKGGAPRNLYSWSVTSSRQRDSLKRYRRPYPKSSQND